MRRFSRAIFRFARRCFVASLFAALIAIIATIIAWRSNPFPVELISATPTSPRVTDRHGRVLLETVGVDEQWRRPIALEQMSPWVIGATIAVEDERFYEHVGVDLVAVLRASGQNARAGRVVSGASTITMQVCRMLDPRPRTLDAKLLESLRAVQLEEMLSKDAILETYLNLAPYGGNYRGVEAASRAWFGKRCADLSLGEAALLAGLPQSPERFRPDRFPHLARQRRDTVLRRMVELGMITREEAAEAANQPVMIVNANDGARANPRRETTNAKPIRAAANLNPSRAAANANPSHTATSSDPPPLREGPGEGDAPHPSIRTSASASDLRQSTIINRQSSIKSERSTDARIATPSPGRDAPIGASRPPSPSEGEGLTTHVAHMALARRPSGGRTTIDLDAQREAARLVREHVAALPRGADAAVVVIDIEDSSILVLIGSADATDPIDGAVNGATAKRSPGSALKPFIYAAAFETRRLNEASMLYDGPIVRAGWSPRNFDGTFNGEITVAEALQRSLNVPAIVTAEGVGLSRCLGAVEAAGVELPADTQQRGGLAVVTGAVEVTLLDLTNAYATLGRAGVRTRPRLFIDETTSPVRALSERTCVMLNDILSSRRRRPAGCADLSPDDVPWFMWKTGTSSGRRDAWAVGHNGRYAIGVWVGRFSGAGDVAFVGRDAAEPLLAKLFAQPAFRRATAPPPGAKSWPVTNPLPSPRETQPTLQIVSPQSDAVFIAIDNRAWIHPRLAASPIGNGATTGNDRATTALNGAHSTAAANTTTTDIRWFHNGRLLDVAETTRFAAAPGEHELRCVTAAGEVDAVRFSVK